ncbi:MAG: aldo/keto reductase [Oscillospiraceae bacterium]
MKKTVRLNDGSSIAQVGFGCFQISDTEMQQVLRWATESGYRYFDTATRYENEQSVGRALRSCGVPRKDLYVVSKIWPICYDNPVQAIEYSLAQLGLEYIDSYYLHWPSSSRERRNKAWEALLQYRQKGLIKSVGVSNFTPYQLQQLIDDYGVVPVVNQVELHPWYQQRELRSWCAEHGVAVTAWGPIFRGHIAEVPLMEELAQKYNKTPVQVTLRWHLQHGNIVIPKSANKERIEQNGSLYDFFIEQADMEKIDALQNGRHFGDDPDTNDGENFIINFGGQQE